MMRYCLFFFFLFSFSLSWAKPIRFRAVLRQDPSQSISIGWEQASGKAPVLYYGPNDLGQKAKAYPLKQIPQKSYKVKGMLTYFARLADLQPNTNYYFVVCDEEGCSQRYSFKTLPNSPKERLSIVAGGDSRNYQAARKNANRLVARLRPHLVVFAGDMTALGTPKQWQGWLDDWQETITPDGRITAMVVARGNHELSNETLYKLFDLPNPKAYYALSLGGNLMRLYTLNSMMPAAGLQAEWLAEDLAEHQDHGWRFAQYHHPMRPHVKRKSEKEELAMAWAPLFERYGVQLALECDSHTSKYTWPIRYSQEEGHEEGFIRDDKNGVVYIGEGGWGAPLRNADDTKSWTRAAGKLNQVKWLFVSLENIEIRTVKSDNASLIGYLDDDSRFSMPKNIMLWQPHQEDHIDLANNYLLRYKPPTDKAKTVLMDLKAKAEQQRLRLFWACKYEGQNYRFLIQHSHNKIYWSTLANLEGAGPSEELPNHYEFADIQDRPLSQQSYYRISVLDEDGKLLDRQELLVKASQENEERIPLLSVNLLRKKLAVPLSLHQAEEKVRFELFDVNRISQRRYTMALGAGKQEVELNIQGLKTGDYLLEISYNGRLEKRAIRLYIP
ncbi:purple acid phosphatase family protein [Saprospira grandis]|uniref:Metallophosphoesterase n=1 Tax=Saprospira grandis (strain Lewin) TaxID=984262 RepID=H6L8U4_SAPGL|nr:metallophosphoesterase family protein [Saprospira grandis]AFC26900.1 metallophosphoesterase [Saprospira grandis str. Lewin]